jgi:type I restriction enzyme S subunit
LRKVAFNVVEESTVRAGDMFEMLLGRQKSARQSVGDNVIPYVRAGNISMAGLKLDDIQTMNFDPSEQERYCLRQDDILLVEGGTVGLAVRWQTEIPGAVGFDKHVIRLRAREARSTSEFALQWARWARESGEFDKQATGITIKALGFGRASAMPVPDFSIEKQARICEPIAAVETALDALRSEIQCLHLLRQLALTSFLAGQSEILDSYDFLLDVVA